MASINQPRSMAITLIAILVIGGGVLGTLWWRQSPPLPSAMFEEPVVVLGENPRFRLQLEAARGNVTGVEVRVVQGEVDALAYQ
jgi:hypothetical protein